MEARTEETQFSASIDRELYSRVLAHPEGYQMTAPLISPFSNRVFSSKISFSEEIKSKSVGYWHTHGAPGKFRSEELSNPEDFNRFLKYSLLSTPSNEWLKATYNGLQPNGKPDFSYEKFNKIDKKWDPLW